MLFKLYLQDKNLTVIGYDWIEVLAIVPFRVTIHEAIAEVELEEGQDRRYAIIQASLYCRTESGITQLGEDDLMDEIYSGIYCEAGGEAQAKQTRDRLAEFLREQEQEQEANASR